MLEHGAYGVVFQVEDTNPDPDSPKSYAMKIQDEGAEYRKELKILSQLNSDRIVRLKKGVSFVCLGLSKLKPYRFFTFEPDTEGCTDGVSW